MADENILPLPWVLREHVFHDGSIAYRIYAGDNMVAAFTRYDDANFVLNMIEFKQEKENLEETIRKLEKDLEKAIDQRDDLQGDVYLLKEELGQAKAS